jgi:hypothetical protein
MITYTLLACACALLAACSASAIADARVKFGTPLTVGVVPYGSSGSALKSVQPLPIVVGYKPTAAAKPGPAAASTSQLFGASGGPGPAAAEALAVLSTPATASAVADQGAMQSNP